MATAIPPASRCVHCQMRWKQRGDYCRRCEVALAQPIKATRVLRCARCGTPHDLGSRANAVECKCGMVTILET